MATRGDDDRQDGTFSDVSLEARIPKPHPLRPVRRLVDDALESMSKHFERVYASAGRRTIAPERLLRALLLQILCAIRGARLVVEQLDHSLLSRWSVGLGADEVVSDHSTFSKNRDRLLEGDMAWVFFARVLKQAQAAGLTSDEHFGVDGTLVDAWASRKSFRRKDGSDDDNLDGAGPNADRNFQGKRRGNDIHASTTDPEARVFRMSATHPERLCSPGHALMQNRNGLVVDAAPSTAMGRAERETAPDDEASR